jgi:hypothetical protein
MNRETLPCYFAAVRDARKALPVWFTVGEGAVERVRPS